MLLRIGTRLGSLKILSAIGTGGTGEVLSGSTARWSLARGDA
jgi:hypothetical protein